MSQSVSTSGGHTSDPSPSAGVTQQRASPGAARQHPSSSMQERLRLSPSTVGSVYPALEHLQQISHSRRPQNASSSSVPPPSVTVSATPSASTASSQHYPPNPPVATNAPRATSGPPVDPSLRGPGGDGPVAPPSAFYTNVQLPTYRQASSSSDPSPVPLVVESPRGHANSGLNASIPDILHSHLVPQIVLPTPSTSRQRQTPRDRQGAATHRGGRTPRDADTTATTTAAAGNNRTRRNRHRHQHQGDATGRSERHRRRSRTQSTSSNQTQESSVCKGPCVRCVVTITSFRWVLVVLSVIGVCCVVTGIVLAALHAAGNSFLFLAIMFIGLGVLLVIVVGVGWKCTPRGHEPLHALFGIGAFRSGQTRERRHRRRHRNRDSNWYGGVMYPEFQFRRPPPSYAASMQDYQNRVSQGNIPTVTQRPGGDGGDESLPNSPPPSYRSRTSTMHSTIAGVSDNGDTPNSRPPTYRSRAPSRRPSLPRDLSDSGEGNDSSAAPADVAFTAPTLSIPSPDYSGTNTSPSSPADPSLTTSPSMPSQISTVTVPVTSDTAAVSSSSATMQVFTVPLTMTSNQTQQDISRAVTGSDHENVVINIPPMSSLSQPPAARPSLHSRMESGDRVLLEQALQTLEDHINEVGGITNQGASFDDSDFNTHL